MGTQTVPLEDYIVKFEIWDTAGQERYRSLAPMYYRGAAAALVVYDITTQESFLGAKTWIEELQRQVRADIVIGLAGNKSDLEDKREVTLEDGKNYAEDNGYLFYETSAKLGHNVNEIFKDIAKKLPKNIPPTEQQKRVEIKLPPKEKKKGCC